MNKTTRLTLAAILASFVTVLSANAQSTTTATPAPATPPPPEAPSVSVTVTPAFVTQYMFRGQRLGGPSFEPTVELDYGNLGVGVWASIPFDNTVPGVSDPEIDPYAYYTIPVNDIVKVVPGFTLYTYPRADENAGFYKITFEPNVAVPLTLGAFTLTPKVYYDVVLQGPTYEVTGAFAVPLKAIGSELDFTAQVGTYKLKDAAKDSNPDTKIWGDYWLAGVSMPFALSKSSKLTIGWAYTKGSDSFVKQGSFPKSENTAAMGRGVFSLSYAITF